MTKVNIYLFLHCVIAEVFCNHLRVKTQDGLVQGAIDIAADNRSFYSFTGIPYAKPPIGLLRFEVPVTVTPWSDVLDATKPHERCVQFSDITNLDRVAGSEDCLYLNVYTPQINNLLVLPNIRDSEMVIDFAKNLKLVFVPKLPGDNKTLLPVMFFIHGGAFIEGSGKKELWGPKLLLQKDVVLVVANYRLGPFGFLSTGDAAQPGNLGMKDQAFALEWTKRNVHNFGGDREKITIFGHSAGGFIAHSFMFSPLTRDKIHAVIAQSGTVFSPFGILPNRVALNRTRFLAEHLGCCKNLTTTEMINCLKMFSPEKLLLAVKPLLEERPGDHSVFRPVLEPNHNGAFWTRHPTDTIKLNEVANVPFMTGLTSEDGSILSGWILENNTLMDDYNKNFEELLPILLYYEDYTAKEEQIVLSRSIRKFYLEDNPIDNSTSTEFTKMCTDGLFSYPALKSVSLHAQYSRANAYPYLFAYQGSETFGKFYFKTDRDFGVTHGDELVYLFNSDELFPEYTLTSDEKIFSNALVKVWTDFASLGFPTSKNDAWHSFKGNRRNNYFFFGNYYMGEVDEPLWDERIQVLNQLYNTVHHSQC